MTTNAAILALRAVSYNRGVTGKTIGMLGICDMVEEYLGVDREKFVKDIVKTNVILDAAIEMWHKKERKACDMHYIEHIGSYADLMNMDQFYVDLYDLYNDGVHKTYKKKFQEYAFYRSNYTIYNMTEEEDENENLYMQHEEAAYDAYMNEPYGSHEDDYDYRSD